MELELLFVAALALSLTFCAMPGAVTAETVRRGLRGGFRPAALVELGSTIGDAVWALLALLGLAILLSDGALRVLIGVAGCLFLLYLAVTAIREAFRDPPLVEEENLSQGAFLNGALISLGNPMQAAFWLSIGGTAIASVVASPQAVHYAVFFAGFMAGSLAWCLILPAVVAFGRRFVTPGLFRGVSLVCGCFMLYIALTTAWGLLG